MWLETEAFGVPVAQGPPSGLDRTSGCAACRGLTTLLALLTSVSDLVASVLVSGCFQRGQKSCADSHSKSFLVKYLHLDSRTELSCTWGGAVGPDTIPVCGNY